MYDIRELTKRIKTVVERHALEGAGQYCRWLTQDEKGSRDLGSTPYGCANAVNILYTIGALPTDMKERENMIRVLQDFQDPSDGLFHNPGNYETHTTAFVSGALDLLDARPKIQAKRFEKYLEKEELYRFMDAIDWEGNPWLGAHLGAGLYASMVLTNTADDAWEDLYFSWLDENADPRSGLWKKGSLDAKPGFHHLASTFHYVFNYEYAKRALPYPEALLERCIADYRAGVCMDFSKNAGWQDIDFTYLLVHAQRRAGIHYEETQAIVKEIADGLLPQMLAMDPDTSEEMNDLNTLFALVCALAVLQDAMPGYIRSSKPYKLVLDKRPFL